MGKSLPRCGLLVVFVCLTSALCAGSRTVPLSPAHDNELTGALAGACTKMAEDPDYCSNQSECVCSLDPEEPTQFIDVDCTGATKRWCEGIPGVCDCNQTGIEGAACTQEAVCDGRDASGNCTGCGEYEEITNVQESVNEYGAPCNDAGDCPT